MADNWWDADETVSPSPAAKQDWWAKDETIEAAPRSKPKPKRQPASDKVSQPTGEVHDGDTFKMRNGGNARLSGVDAFELTQQGRTRNGIVAIGRDARDYLQANISPGSIVQGTGAETYGRPVVTLETGGEDVSRGIIDTGYGLAAPEYLRGDPRLTEYMESERLARLNRRGAHAGQFQSPADFRNGSPEPWAAPQQGVKGNSDAVFFDDPTPFQGLRPEIGKGYLALASDPKTTAADLMAYAKANGFQIDEGDLADFLADRANPGVSIAQEIVYKDLPQVLTNPGDGAVGAGVRGLTDPINMLDEIGGVVDTLGGTDGRESIWTSDRRFGDILYNNIDQNRSILAYDDAEHPYARFGGQLASGIIIPGSSLEGVGLAAARQVLREGGSRFAAEAAAKAAVRSRAGVAGAVEGGVAGFGAGEGGIVERLPGAGVGAVTGLALGRGAVILADTAGAKVGNVIADVRARRADPDPDPDPAVASRETWGENDPVLAAASNQRAMISEMANEAPSQAIAGPRIVDRIDVNDRPRPIADPATDLERMRRAENIQPGDVVPIPSNEVASLDEAAAIGKGMYAPVRAGDETEGLARRNLPSPVDATRTLPKRGPLDLVTFMRSKGGLVDQGGELRAMGIRDNAGRDLDFARGEQRFGKLLDNDNGMRLDEAADLAWREGYFPDHAERPTVAEFLDALDNTNRGTSRAFRPDDLPEIDAYNAARDRRLAVERAKDEGAPLVEDRGQPATLADLEANQPPVSAYEEWGENAPDFAGNIRLSNLDSPQNIKRALVVTERHMKGFEPARRGRIRQQETQRLANELGMTPDDLLKRRKGQAFNAEEALAARQILAKSGNELVNMARAIQRLDDPGEEKLAAFRQAWVRHVAIQEQVAGATAEAGRALSQFRQMADSRFVRGNVLDALSQGGGGADRLKRAADLILENTDDPRALNKIARDALKSTWGDKFNEFYINSLLSGPQTHVVNALSNTMTAIAQIPEHAIAAGIGGVRTIVSRQKIADRVLFSELGARSVGLLQGTKEGLRQAARTLRTGDGSDFGTKVEARMQDAIPGTLGKVIRTPTRLLSASDELYKGIARRMELNGLAIRKASAEGLTGRAARQRAADLVANPTDEMLDQAYDYGRYLTFQRPLGKIGRAATMLANSNPILKATVPFVRTPTNLLKFALERSPAAPILSEFRRDVGAGGAKRDLALARAAVGSGVGALVASMAAEGKITGNGPADEGAKALLLADGWQPYSLKVGDRYYSYQRLDPFATTLGVAAGMVELQDHMTDKQQAEVAMLVSASIMQNLSSKTWLSGIGDLVEAVNDPTRYAENWWERLASSTAVPAGVAQVARTADPVMREAEGVLDAIRARVPTLSNDLPAKRDVFGRPIAKEGGVGPDLVSPIWQRERKNDPVIAALLDAGAHVNKPKREVYGRRLSATEYGEYQELTGQIGHSSISELIRLGEWAKLDRDAKQDEVSDIMRDARKEAREALFAPNP